MRSEAGPARGTLLVAVLAGLAHLVVGYFYLVSGLVVPGYALIPLWVWWALLAWLLVGLAVRRSWWTSVVPVVACGSWWLLLWFGETVLGWQP
jgi:hypothetical protein